MVDHEVDFIWILVSFLVHLFYVSRKVLTNLLADTKPARAPADNGFLLYKGERDVAANNSDDKRTTTTMSSTTKVEAVEVKKAKRRPLRIVIPLVASTGFGAKDVAVGEKEVEVEGSDYCLFSRKGKRHVMEDGYGVMTDINGDPKQAFFGVFDGHGGRAAVDYVSQKLGENIVRTLAELGGGKEDDIENAIKIGYVTTDKEFLSKGVSSGACAATALLKDGVLHVANAGDCRAVMSKNGVAIALTTDHRPGREDERNRIESLGGYVHCRNQVWRVQDSLAVSRSFGDSNLKEWIISEPETNKLRLTSECHSLIIASDGLWEKVTDQEAVDVVSRNGSLMKSCKELVDMSCRRGTRDDVSVMVVDLRRFNVPTVL